MTDKLTDLRGKFFVVEDAAVTDYNLTPYEGWLYIVMLKHANRDTGELFPSVKTLVKETQMSKAQVLRATKSLEAKGLIRVTRDEKKNGKDRSVNHYFILAATRYLPDTDPGIYQTPPPVSTRDMNQNQLEPEKDSPTGVGDSHSTKSKTERPANPMYDAIKEVWGYTAARNGQMAHVLNGTATKKGYAEYNLEHPITPDELRRWATWYRKTELNGDSHMNMVEELIKVQSSITRWQELNEQKKAPPLDPAMDLSIPVPFDPLDNLRAWGLKT